MADHMTIEMLVHTITAVRFAPRDTRMLDVNWFGTTIGFVLGQTIAGTALLLGGIGGGIGAIFARRGTSGDLERVNSLEYADERDRAAAVKGLAAVGVVALILSAGQLIMHVIVDADPLSRWASIGVFLALTVCWFLANWYYVRKG